MNRDFRAQLIAHGCTETDATNAATTDYPTGNIGHLDVRVELDDELRLAHDSHVPLVVRDGAVIALDGTDRFVNSSVDAFFRTLVRYKKYVDAVVAAATDAEGEQLAFGAAEDMRSLDPEAFNDDNFYWPIICSQMIDGNL